MLCRFGWSELQSTGTGDGLVEGGVDPPVGGDLGQQPFAVGRAQLLDLAVLQQRVDELRPLVAHPLQRRGVGRVAGLRALLRRQAPLVEQDLAQLDRRVDVELPPDDVVEVLGEAGDLAGEVVAERLQLGGVDGDADVLHAGQHAHEGVLDVGVELGHALRLQRPLERGSEAADGEGEPRGAPRVVDAGVAEVELAGRVGIVDGECVRRVLLEQRADRVLRLGRVDQVGGDGGVEHQAGDVDALCQQRAHERPGLVPAQLAGARRARRAPRSQPAGRRGSRSPRRRRRR